MSSLHAKGRVHLCLFSFTDGRRCRTPRTGRHPHFCFYHAQKEARSQAADKPGEDLAYFFSGDYLSACDLSTAMACLVPAVVRGDIKPKLARTIAYMVQTLIQTIHLSQDEYINAISTDDWRKAVRNSVNQNSDYRNPQPEEADEPEKNQAESSTPPPAQRPVPALVPQSRPAPAPVPQSPTPHPNASSPHASSTTNQSADAITQLSLPNSAPGRSAEQAARPAAQTASDAPLSPARSVFRRRPNATSANFFNTNIYTAPRNY